MGCKLTLQRQPHEPEGKGGGRGRGGGGGGGGGEDVLIKSSETPLQQHNHSVIAVIHGGGLVEQITVL